MTNRICITCKGIKPCSDFYDCLGNVCKECKRSQVTEWKRENSDRVRQSRKEWREKNKHRVRKVIF